MSEKTFKKYIHLERFGTESVDDIEIGECIVQPKIDGTCSSVWATVEENGSKILHCGSRNRELSLEKDNAGFMKYVLESPNMENLRKFCRDHTNYVVYGEFLVPHSLRTYREDAWNKFYIFDILELVGGDEYRYLPYDEYQPLMEEYDLLYIPVIAIVKNGTYENFIKIMHQNTYLIKDGEGFGEGIVIKRYDYKNKFGRYCSAKIVSSEFKEKHFRKMGPPKINGVKIIEEEVVDKYCTETFIEKTFQKILNDSDGNWNSKMIPRLLNTVYHDFVVEEIWQIVKNYKNPKIDFKTLKFHIDRKIKKTKSSLF